MVNPERVQVYHLYQLVHGKERSVGMAKGERRKLDDGIEEYDTYIFNITRRDGNLNVTGEVFTDRYKIKQDESRFGYKIGSMSYPFKISPEAKVQLIEPTGEETDYEDPISPVETFKTGQGKLVNLNPDLFSQPPILIINNPETQ